MPFYAHTRANTSPDDWEPLRDHLERTAIESSQFASSFAPLAAHLAGLWHDLGKYNPKFQNYMCNGGPSCEHSIVGAYQAYKQNRSDIALAIAAHHGYLKDQSEFLHNEIERGGKISFPIPPDLLVLPAIETPPADARALWIRFLFSALVDADSLQSELWETGIARWRSARTIPELKDQLESYISDKLAQREPSPVDPLRRDVQQRCRERAVEPVGSFRLTVPTGGGKTIASLLFALHHAHQHSLRRVIVVIPYTSIIEQTANTFRAIFGSEAVLEHHSNLDPKNDSPESRKCVENWDSPIIVTTSVQFFQSLHANHKRDLRKLHNIAESVVVLDEVQTFPIELIKPIKDVLDRLNKHFRVSTVHCSATQPLLVQSTATEIVRDPAALFAITRNRVQVHWNLDEPAEWPALAAQIRAHQSKQVLTIVNTKRDAFELTKAVGEDCIYLSTLLCPQHRKQILKEIRSRLDNKQPCIVVSTQLVEAGVDIDFPVVYRALAGLDSLAQAAGRCNREGTQPVPGQFHVFLAASDPPPGTPRAGFKIVRRTLNRRRICLFDPKEYVRYFKDLDELRAPSAIPELEAKCNFPEVDRLFKMIEDEGTPLIAPHGDWRARVDACRQRPSNEAFRALQPYTVSVRRKFLEALRATGCLEPLAEDSESRWFVFRDHKKRYSERFGFAINGTDELPFLEAQK